MGERVLNGSAMTQHRATPRPSASLSRATLAVVVSAIVISATSCRTVLGLDELTYDARGQGGGGADHDAGADSEAYSSDASPDADATSTAAFRCATATPPLLFCADFDEGPVGQGWDSLFTTNDGTI